MHQLLRKMKPPEDLPSTGVAKAVAVVELDTSSTTTDWKTMEIEESLVGQVCESLNQELDPIRVDESTLTPTPALESPASPDLVPDSTSKAGLLLQSLPTEALATASPTHKSLSPTPELENEIEKNSEPTTIISDDTKLVISKYYKNFNDLKKRCSLYMRDAGGQVEYQEMVPLLVSAAFIFFFVFRADVALKEMFKKKYRIDNPDRYTSAISVKEALLQCLANVYAMGMPRKSQGDSAHGEEHKARIFLVATHVDKLDPSSRDQELQDLDKRFHSLTEGFKKLVLRPDSNKGRLLFAVNNLSDSQKEFDLIRSNVRNLIATYDEFTVKNYPVRNLLFSLRLQSDERITLSLKECAQIAAKFCINENEIVKVLKFLHSIGIVQYYDIDGVRDFVVIKPEFLFVKATDVIENPFPPGCPVITEQQEDWAKGILQLSILESNKDSSEDSIAPKHFVSILKHLRIVAQVPGNQEKYFIPCLLNRLKDKPHPEPNISPKISTLAIKFGDLPCPKGLFGVLITRLMDHSHEAEDKISLKLLKEEICKNEVSFEVCLNETRDKVSLQLHSSHIAINYFNQTKKNRFTQLGEMCSKTCSLIEESIGASIDDLHYSHDSITPLVCFKCDRPGCHSDLHRVFMHSDGLRYFCHSGKENDRIPKQASYWFNEGRLCV